MWAGAGRYLPAFGPWGVCVLIIIVLLAILAVGWIIHLISKHQIGEGEIHVRILGISVRWVTTPNKDPYRARHQKEPEA